MGGNVKPRGISAIWAFSNISKHNPIPSMYGISNYTFTLEINQMVNILYMDPMGISEFFCQQNMCTCLDLPVWGNGYRVKILSSLEGFKDDSPQLEGPGVFVCPIHGVFVDRHYSHDRRKKHQQKPSTPDAPCMDYLPTWFRWKMATWTRGNGAG